MRFDSGQYTVRGRLRSRSLLCCCRSIARSSDGPSCGADSTLRRVVEEGSCVGLKSGVRDHSPASPIATHGEGLSNPRGSLVRYATQRVPAGHIWTALTATQVEPVHGEEPHTSAHGRDCTTSYVNCPVHRCGPSQLGGGKHVTSGSSTCESCGGGVIEFPHAKSERASMHSADR